jgi:hypothetical protein
MTTPRRTGSAPERLRADIDSGRTGDKVRAFDPSAAPFGTDAEAAGTPLPDDEVEAVRRRERNSAPSLDRLQLNRLLSGTVAAVTYLSALALLLWAIFS